MKVKQGFLPILTIFISICLCLVILEIGIRVFAPALYWPNRDPMDDWQLDKLLGWVQKPNIDSTERMEFGWTLRFRTNEDGLTPGSAHPLKEPGKIRVMFFGDSVVVGRAVPQDQTVSAQLEKLLTKNGLNVEVLNAGVQAYGTDQSLLRMEQLLPIYHPDIVIYGLCQNDFFDNQSSEIANKAKPMFKMMENGDVEFIYPVLKDKIYPGGYGLSQLIRYSAVYRFLRPALYNLRRTLGITDNKSNIISIDAFYYKPELLNKLNWKLFAYLLRRMKQTSMANEAQFFFYAHPALQEVWNPVINDLRKSLGLKPEQYDRFAIENRLMKLSAEENIIFMPLISYFLQHESEGPFHLLPSDPHCNQTGYRLIATKLYSYLTQTLIDKK